MIIERKEYLEKLIAWKDKQLIKIVTGVLRCGKSMLLEIYRNYLKEHGIEEEQIISINFEDLDYEELTDYRKLYKYLKERLIDGKMTYIFLDEIQNVTDFPKVLDSLYIKKNIDIYVTGSNAYMLSSEIATMISGRYIQIEMLPLSFKEYMESTGSMNDRGIKYAEYLQNSSFPFTLELKNQPDEIRDYLEGIYNTIVVKDIINRKKITDTMMLKSVLRFVFDNIGNPLSSKKIADTMTSEGRKIDTKELEIDLPGFKKDEVKAELNNGYLTVSAAKGLDEDKEDKKTGKYIRRERYAGACQRSYYVGEDVTEEDIKATFEHGILTLFVPKKEAKPAVEEKKYISIQ